VHVLKWERSDGRWTEGGWKEVMKLHRELIDRAFMGWNLWSAYL